MTLQNKKMQLLGDDENASDVVDIFDQYGGSSDDGATTTSSDAQNVTRPASDDVTEDSEKKWEQEYEETPAQSVKTPKPDKTPQQQAPPAVKEKVDTAPITQEEKLAYVQKMKPKKPKEKEDTVKVVSPPKIDSAPKEVQTIEKELKEDVPLPPQKKNTASKKASKKKNYNSVEQKETKKDMSKVFVPAHSESVHAATAATKETAQMVKQSYVSPKDQPKRDVHVDPSKKTIMIVDDDVATLDMYADIFEQADYNVIRASDGLEAMSLVAEHTPHIIFTGIVMPRMDGFSMMEALKQNKRTADIPIVINSHLGREEDKNRAEELGARDFIVRGFTPPREALERVGAMLLRSEYVFCFDKNDADARKLAKDLGMTNFFMCPRGQDMVLKLHIIDEKDMTFSARFSCVDSKDKK
ncbi:MAG: response regulator [Patescibacteria group bacterium]|nr:response regulator [Patescibacteria group bacterium]